MPSVEAFRKNLQTALAKRLQILRHILAANEQAWQTCKHAASAVILAAGVWYLVIGSAQAEGRVEVRMDYRGLPDGMVVREGLVRRVTVHLRGSGELMRSLYNRDLSYTADLSHVDRGANVLLPDVASMPEFRAYEVVEIVPGRLVLEVDTLQEKIIPVEMDMVPVPDTTPFRLNNVLLEPAFVTVKGPESQIRNLHSLTVFYDPNQDLTEGSRAVNLAIAAPEQVEITPPVTTLRYTLTQLSRQIDLIRVIQLDGDNPNLYDVRPRWVRLTLEVPEGREDDTEYQSAIRVMARLPDTLEKDRFADVPMLVVLPAGSRLLQVDPPLVRIFHAPAPSFSGLPRPENNFSGYTFFANETGLRHPQREATNFP